MVSVNEQFSPILDVEHGPARSKEMRLTIVLDFAQLCSEIIFLRIILILKYFFLYL